MFHCTSWLVNGTMGAHVAEYFVVGPEPIVAQDLADAIRANDRHAAITVFRDPHEAAAALTLRQPAAVVVHREPAGFRETALGMALMAAEIPCGFLCAECADAEDAEVLQSPFTEATVKVLMAGLRRDLREDI